MHNGYLRTPTIHGDTVAFVCEDDLWTVPAAGGLARRLTANLSAVSRPHLSPDGRWLAFTGTEEQHPEVYLMPSEGGPATRLTYLGAVSSARGWTPDGRIVFSSDAKRPMRTMPDLFTVPLRGGQPEQLAVGPAQEIAFGPGGAIALGRNTNDPARWKRYRGGMAGQIWVDARGDGKFRRLIDTGGNLGSPMWAGDRVLFISDHEGVGNIYSCRRDGRDLRRHTDHGDYYARFASTDGSRVVYQCGAEIWLLDLTSGSSSRIDVDLRSTRTQSSRKFVQAEHHLDHFAPHPEGHSVAVEVRGKAFTMPLWEEAVRQYGSADGARYRLGSWLSDGRTLVVTSDEDGEERIEVHPPDGPARRLTLDHGRAVELVPSPKGSLIALTNHRLELLLVDTEKGTAKVGDVSAHGRITDPAWSSDGRWLAYSFASTVQTRSIKLLRISDGSTHFATHPEFRDFCPSFDPAGKYLSFISYRSFDPVYDSLFFDLGFPKASRPYLVTLRSDEGSPFVPRPKGFGEPAAPADEKAGKSGKKSKNGGETSQPEPVRIDLDGITERVLAFPVGEGRYTKLRSIKGKVLFTSLGVEGSLDQDFMDTRGGARHSLDAYDFGELKQDNIASGVADFEVSADASTLVYLAGRRLRALKAGDKPDPSQDREGPGRKSGWIDLNRIRPSVSPPAEWRQMLREAWRLQRDHFWVADMSGVDWEQVYRRYLPLVDKVATRLEFSDLMWEMQGELGTSHAYELGGDHRAPPSYPIGHLGADFVWDARARGYRITHIVRGAGWEPERDSPLRAPGVNVSEGDVLLAINARPLAADMPPAALLVNQAGVAVELRVAGPRGRNPRSVIVKTLRSETPARYREWVQRNRARVHEATGGRAGYIHIPDMGAPGYAEFHRSYLSELDREGLVVDVRSNGGGHVSQILLEKLARRRIGYAVTRWGSPEPYPSDSVLGPMVCITDEQAGSDGDIFTHCFKLLKLGPVVGKRTWGGVVGISPSHRLADGSVTTQPEASYWFTDVGFGVENYGTDPDFDVDVTPQDYAAGRDPQMDKSLQLIGKALSSFRPRVPDTKKRPNLALPVLPKRS